MISAGEWDRIRWQSRRGMREIDLMLEPFVNNHLPSMPEKTVKAYEEFLNLSDLQLVRFLLRHDIPTDPETKAMADLIISCHMKDFPDGEPSL